uniref:Capsid protein n=1 Tax=Cressdnaviricota sp. TaxID=2748378 RepID=A0A6M9Z8Q6_9VIRU|nr:MAG: capsid protein [Cressdnaviricota sp.]QKN88868.1 MAG: capsid protein [Cressdnaviricota sp.]QKN88882.1 MAG: capsid protein [Cressdnaviricota sp.]
MVYKRKRGFHIPGYNYCGPGTYYSGKQPDPINRIDAACKRHDNDPRFTYDYYNDADEDLIRDVEKYYKDDPIAAGIVSGVFRTKRYITPYKRHKLAQNDEDLPSNSLSNVPNRSIGKDSTSMRYAKRARSRIRRMGYGKRRRYSNRLSATKSTRRASTGKKSYDKSFSQKVARVLNPSRSYEYSNGSAITFPSSQNNSFIVDPHVMPITTRTASTDISLARKSRLFTIYNKITGDTISTAAGGYTSQAFWAMNRREYFKFSNFSNSTMFITVYWVCPRKPVVDPEPLNYLDAAYASTLQFIGEPPANLIGSTIAVNNHKYLDKQVNIKELPQFNKWWSILRRKDIKLEPNDQTTIVLYNKDRLINSSDYGALECIRDKRLLLRVRTELTADGTIATSFGNKGYSFTSQTLVTYVQQKCDIAPRISKQKQSFIENPTGTGVNFGNDPKMVGDPVDDAGAPMNDVS